MFSGPVQNVRVPNEQFNQMVPFYRRVDGGFLPPKKIRIVAIPRFGKFQVNLKGDNGETFFHFNARFDENVVVRNCTKFGGKWQKEERHGHFPFQAGTMFTLEIEATYNSVKVSVNGEEFTEFEHRDNFRAVDQLEVDGDFDVLHSVGIVEN